MIKLAKYFNSIQFVVVCIVMFQIMLVIDTATLLYTSFPEHMLWATKLAASIGGAITIEAFLLMVSANMYLMQGIHGKNLIPFMFGVVSTIMTLFFLETFTEYETVIACKKVFVSLVFGLINYLLSEVFVKKWQEFNHLNDVVKENEILNSKLSNLKSQYSELLHKHESCAEYNKELRTNLEMISSQNKLSQEVFDKLEAEIETLNKKLSRKKNENGK